MKAHRPDQIEVGNKIYKIVDNTCEFFVYSVLFQRGNCYYYLYMGLEWPISVSGRHSCYDIFELSIVEEVLL